jgi:YD repeat-containing protein
MVSVVTGGGGGLVNTSKEVLGGAGELGNAPTGRAGEQVTVNAANGNLIVQSRDEYLAGTGPDVNLLRTYNSQGGWDGDNNDSWRLGYYRRVSGLVGTANASGSSLQRVDADGNQSTYFYNGSRYVSTNGSGQYDSLSFDGTNWTWTDGDSGFKETYELAGAGNYRLTRVEDPDGNAVRVAYDASSLITTLGTYKTGANTATESLTFMYVGTALQKVTANTADGGRSTISYSYYPAEAGVAAGRLKSVTTDLTPANGGDSKVYVTTYDYDASGRLAELVQTDGTALYFDYYTDGRIKQVRDRPGCAGPDNGAEIRRQRRTAGGFGGGHRGQQLRPEVHLQRQWRPADQYQRQERDDHLRVQQRRRDDSPY